MARIFYKWVTFLAIVFVISACGVKGPPLPPKDSPPPHHPTLTPPLKRTP